MGSEWAPIRLGDACTKIGSGATPRGGKDAYRGGSTALIRSQNIYNDRFSSEGIVYIDDAQARALRNVNVCAEDVLLNITGDSVARCCQVSADVLPARVNQHVAIIRTKPDVLDSRFLRYALVSPSVQNHLLALASAGATRNALTKAMIESLSIQAPCLEEQRAIAHILGTLDDKIELNRQQNKTLEDMARALFKAWFVDFEPVRAKMEGRWQRGQSLPGLPADIFDLFPDRLVESELGEIPEGWEVRSVSDFADLTGGKQLEKEKITSFGDIPVFGGAGIMGYTDSHNADGFVIAVGRVGAYCGQFFSHRGKAWINNNASLIRHRKEDFCEWLLLSLRHADIDVIKKGAAQPFVSNGDIARLPTLWPGELLVQKFSLLVKTIFKLQEKAAGQSRTLAQLRDTLLPKLISGEVRVPSHFLKETK